MTEVVFGDGEVQTDEREAAAAVEPGELVEFAADGRVQPHSTDAGEAPATRFAKAAREVGKTIEDTYTYDGDLDEGENVHYGYPAPGTPVPGAWLAAGENVTPGTPLVSAGDGTLRAYDSANDPAAAIVAYSNEATDNGGGAEAVRHEVIPE